ncbi:MAG TPA: imidazolonepropionase, partial [Deltaproteobacteria bacterium]|nr:imidazolonepropionase [Deltaproteobacteria bacterium]
TTIEVKSGYGLDTENELRLLETVLYCDRNGLPDLVPTFLGAHTLPAEARESEAARDRYVSLVVDEMLPQVARRRLARFCDVFIEEGAFRLDEGRKVLERAKGLGLGLKVHADQLTHTGGASLAAELGAVSVEHIEHASDADLAALAAAGTVAVLLPGASFFLRDEPVDAGRLRKAGVSMALATDQNPGSSPTDNLLLMAQMGVLASGMTIEEALLGITTHAARSLGMERDRGRVAPGMRADLALFRCEDPRELLYRFGAPLCSGVIKDGRYQRVEAGRMGGLRQHQ